MTETIDVEAAIRRLEEGTTPKRVDTLETLSNLSNGQPDAFVPYIDDICHFGYDKNPNIRSFVATILSNVARHDPSVVVPHSDVVRALLTDDNPYVITFATAAAMKVASASPEKFLSATDRLVELLTYENAEAAGAARSTRKRSILALGYLTDADPTLPAQLDEPFAERLDDAEPMVRAATVTTLTRLGLADPEAIPTALASLPARLDDPDPETRRHTVEAYVYFRHKQSDAIVNPKTVAPAFEKATDCVDLDDEEVDKVTETTRYLKELAAEQ